MSAPSAKVLALMALQQCAKSAVTAQIASERASDARMALPPGSSRAKVTSANARWSSCAEDRDRKMAALQEAVVRAGFQAVSGGAA